MSLSPCFQVKAGGLVVVMKEATGLRGTGAEGVAALNVGATIVVALNVGVTIVVALNVGAMIVVALTEVEEEQEARPLVWGKSESLPPPTGTITYC